jgi:NAD-dependent SIR2 family protein deacetylase
MKCVPDCTCLRHTVDPGTRGGRTWQSENPTIRTIHGRLGRARGKAREHKCVDCGEQADEWSQIHGTDYRDINNYEPRCYSCHKYYDDPQRWGKPGYKEAQVQAATGRKHTEETKRKMSESAKKRWARK